MNNSVFSEVERKISGHNLRIPADIMEDSGIEMSERRKTYRDNLNNENNIENKSTKFGSNLLCQMNEKFMKYFRYFIIHAVVLIYMTQIANMNGAMVMECF
ncbi:hypothetical protein PV328_004754 [Microctonus aethiopoides]|uniref:Uncharacterized protein n=1 Tax=Microctonus aethiopoides TaxID=144406 RepID=A0AA39KLV9_9HYME|nr:hypothetical protein PV328_004754 [Microctonus aethiopoides]